MAFLNNEELDNIGFKYIGTNVLISDKVSIYNADQIEIGDNSRIDDFCVLSGRIKIGRNVHVAVFCNVAGGEMGIDFSDFSGLAYGCHVFTQSDDYNGQFLTNPTVPDEYKSEIKLQVNIGKHVIVGANSVVLPGVDLADGTSVGAMSLVTKSTLPWHVYFGIPAKKLKARKNELLDLEKKYLADSCATDNVTNSIN